MCRFEADEVNILKAKRQMNVCPPRVINGFEHSFLVLLIARTNLFRGVFWLNFDLVEIEACL